MKKRIFSIAVAGLLTILMAFGVSAADPAYENDFSSGSLKVTEWKTLNLDPDSNGAWDIADVGGNKQLRGQIAKFNDSIIYYKTQKFKDVTVEADITLERGNAFGIIARMDAEAKGYQIIFDQFDGIKLCKRPYYMFKSGGMVDTGTQYHVVFSVIGSKVKAQITSKSTGETLTLDTEDNTYTEAGFVGFSVFGFDTDGRSNAVGLVDNVKIYEGEVTPATEAPTQAPTQDGGNQTETPATNPTQGQDPAPTDEDNNNPDSTQPASSNFTLSSKYTDAVVDNTAKTVTLTRQLNVSELRDTFEIPDGYTLQILDKSGNPVTDAQTIVTADMQLSFTKDGGAEQRYTLKLEGDSAQNPQDTGFPVWIIVVIVVVVLAGAGVGGFFLYRRKAAKKPQ